MDAIQELGRLRRELLRIRELIFAGLGVFLSDPTPRNLERLMLDFTSLDAATAEVSVITASLQSTISGDVSVAVDAQKAADATAQTAAVAAAVAAQEATDQADLETHVAGLNDAITALKAQASTGSDDDKDALAVSPSPAIVPLGSTAPVPLTFTGGTGVITASGLPAGVTFDGANLVADGTQTAGSTTVIFSDSSTPPLSASLTVTVQ